MRSLSEPKAFQSGFFQRFPLAEHVMRLFEGLPGVTFYAKDTASRFVRVNSAFLANHGFGPDQEAEVLGRDDRDLSPPAMAAAYMEEDQRVMTGRQPIPGQVWLVYHVRRLPQWYVSTKTPLFDAAGEVIGLAGAMYRIDRPTELAAYTHELLPVIQHIQAHFAEPVSMAQMAKLAGLSATHFNRRFQQLLRMTPLKYLRTVRIQAAQQRLANTDQPLAAIAADSGFTDQSHFTRRFREVTGMTPSAYRRRFRAEL